MKLFKKIITSILACSLVFACCFGLVGCDFGEVEQTTETGTEILGTSVATVYNAEYAESIYYDAIRNFFTQKQRKNHLMQQVRDDETLWFDSYEMTTYVKDGIYCMNENEWFKDGKIYNDSTKTYTIPNKSAEPFTDIPFYFIKTIEAAESRTFKCAILNSGVTKVYLDVQIDDVLCKFVFSIKDNLITEISAFEPTFEGSEALRDTVISIEYDNVSFPRELPNFSTYTEDSGITPLQ